MAGKEKTNSVKKLYKSSERSGGRSRGGKEQTAKRECVWRNGRGPLFCRLTEMAVGGKSSNRELSDEAVGRCLCCVCVADGREK